MFHRKSFGTDQCNCGNCGSNCGGYDYTWFATCSEGVIQGTAFSGENVLEMKTSNLNGLVNAEKMILKDGNSQYTIHKV